MLDNSNLNLFINNNFINTGTNIFVSYSNIAITQSLILFSNKLIDFNKNILYINLDNSKRFILNKLENSFHNKFYLHHHLKCSIYNVSRKIESIENDNNIKLDILIIDYINLLTNYKKFEELNELSNKFNLNILLGFQNGHINNYKTQNNYNQFLYHAYKTFNNFWFIEKIKNNNLLLKSIKNRNNNLYNNISLIL